MTAYARLERARLADLLLETGPDAPTLCTGWSTRDLAAHLVVRDRRPDASLGLIVAPLAGHGEHVRKQKAAESYDKVVAEVRRPPWWSPVSNRLVNELANHGEFFIHLEDVRRGGETWEPRDLDEGERTALWRLAKFGARMTLRKLKIPVVLRAPGLGEAALGGDGPAQATLTAEPGEFVLFFSGRQRATRVEIEAAPEIEARLRTASSGI
ncbi:TIGR03085 family metal-binding protein [Actinoplanes sp. NBRC 103695]|uniref:TIGR03085 family metal-binding protein n=1 Tax=Actinoplanes sp. NBRC 103695 TaxID=3032202 RepID=UPI0025558E7E|nr:TIGR03085 family metal-binding protein [Actinoplanes sp. NBRC 103695]